MQILLNSGADVDAADHHGFTPIFYAVEWRLHETIRLLGQAECCLHSLPDCSDAMLSRTVLSYVIWWRHKYRHALSNKQASVKDYEATVDLMISLLGARRQRLGDLVNTSLTRSMIKKLYMSPGKLLDHKAPLAVAMLKENGILSPRSLLSVEFRGGTVYHLRDVHLKQAKSLWQAGFCDVNGSDRFGKSPLMGLVLVEESLVEFKAKLELLAWLVSKGADLHGLQDYAYRIGENGFYPSWFDEALSTDVRSSITALHYIGDDLGELFSIYATLNLQSLDSNSISQLSDILSDTVRDACRCACSAGGCLAFTMMAKFPVRGLSDNLDVRIARVRMALVRCTHFVAELLEIEETKMAWLRAEIFRINCFEELQLTHTCCKMSYHCGEEVIAEFGDEEDREEIREEQEEEVEKLESLVLEFEDKYQELGIPFVNFMDGYWCKRMEEVLREGVPVDREQLLQIGVLVEKDGDMSSDASSSGSEEIRESGYTSSDTFDDTGEIREGEDAHSDEFNESEEISEVHHSTLDVSNENEGTGEKDE